MKKIIIGILAVLILLAAGVQVFLQIALTEIVKDRVIPELEQETGVEILIDHVSVNLLRGSARLNGLIIGNPDGFTEPEMAVVESFYLNIRLIALARRSRIDIRNLTIANARIDIVRNAAGEINVQKLAESGEPSSVAAETARIVRADEKKPVETQKPSPLAEPPALAELPRFFVRRAAAHMKTRYTDYNISPETPFVVDVHSSVKLKNISSRESDRQPPGKIEIIGSVVLDSSESNFKVAGTIDPVSDYTRLTFELDGEMDKISLASIEPYIAGNDLDIISGSVSGTLKLLCTDGVFDSQMSVFNLVLHDISLSEERRRRMGNISLPREITVPVHIGGTMLEPEIDKGAIANTILSEILQSLGASAGDAIGGQIGEFLEKKQGTIRFLQKRR